jgi:hypothetical protein
MTESSYGLTRSYCFFLFISRSTARSSRALGPGGRTCILSRVYPSLARGDKARLHVFNNGKAPVKVAELTAWEMKSAAMNGEHF